jgi:peptide/nickel transport system permease protein
MIAFVIRRLLQSVLVMLTVAFIAFGVFTFIGDPVLIMLGQDYTQAQYDALVQQLGLDQPFYVQFSKFVWNALQGEFGLSYRLQRPVGQLIVERLPATLELSLMAAALALLVGVPMGVYTGLKRDSWLSRFFLAISLIGVSLPTFLIGILLILTFAVQLGGCRPSAAATWSSSATGRPACSPRAASRRWCCRRSRCRCSSSR